MMQTQGAARAFRAWRSGAVLLCLPWLAACPDGYPTEDLPALEPARMTQTQLLAALNELGDEPGLPRRWRFTLHPQCELEVSVRGADASPRRVTLDGAEVSSRAADGVSDILVLPADDSQAPPVTVLQTQRWSDTVVARSLLTHLEIRCGQAESSGS